MTSLLSYVLLATAYILILGLVSNEEAAKVSLYFVAIFWLWPLFALMLIFNVLFRRQG